MSATISADVVYNVVGGTKTLCGTLAQANVVFGIESSVSATSGEGDVGYNYNIAIGDTAMINSVDTTYSIVVGPNAGEVLLSSVALIVEGPNAGLNVQNTRDSTFLGANAGYFQQSGKNNLFVGANAGSNSNVVTSNTCNLVMGDSSFLNISYSESNILVGANLLTSTVSSVSECIFLGNTISGRSFTQRGICIGNSALPTNTYGSNFLAIGHDIGLGDPATLLSDSILIGNRMISIQRMNTHIVIANQPSNVYFYANVSRDFVNVGGFGSSNVVEKSQSIVVPGLITRPYVGTMTLSTDYLIPDASVVCITREFPGSTLVTKSLLSASVKRDFGLMNGDLTLVNFSPRRIAICGNFILSGTTMLSYVTTDYIDGGMIRHYDQVSRVRRVTPGDIMALMMQVPPGDANEFARRMYYLREADPPAPAIRTLTFKRGVTGFTIGPGPWMLPPAGGIPPNVPAPVHDDYYVDTQAPLTGASRIYVFNSNTNTYFTYNLDIPGRIDAFADLSGVRAASGPLTSNTLNAVQNVRATSNIYFALADLMTTSYTWVAAGLSEFGTVANIPSLPGSAPGGRTFYVTSDRRMFTNVSALGLSWIPVFRAGQIAVEPAPPFGIVGGTLARKDYYDELPPTEFQSFDTFVTGSNIVLKTDASGSTWQTISLSGSLIYPAYTPIAVGTLSY